MAANQEPQPETVAVLLEMAERVLDDERARGQSLDAKTATLAGFSGAILALAAGLAPAIAALEVSGGLEVALRSIYGLTILALAGAAVLTVAGVLRPQPRVAIAVEELEGFARFPLIALPAVEVQGRMINTVVEALAHERVLNDRKARLTRRTGLALATGFVGFAAQALTIGFGVA